MAIWDAIRNIFQFEPIQAALQKGSVFLIFVFLSFLLGRQTPNIIKSIAHRFSPQKSAVINEDLIIPVKQPIIITATFIYLSISLNWLEEYRAFYNLLKPFSDFAVIFSLAWLASRLFRQFFRVYGIELLKHYGWKIDEVLLVLETLVNILIGFIAVLAFAQSLQLNLVGLLASLGLGGIAIAFAAQKTLEQFLGTIVLYLDRPFIPGDYVRLPQVAGGLIGRVESIGLRSTKIRTVAKGTLFIVPNSTLANMEIENLTHGKKVMVLLNFDFLTLLDDRKCALVQQVITESTDSLFGIDPGSTKITLSHHNAQRTSRARVTFFILGSSENSIQLRKHLLELANEKISQKLKEFGIEFTMQEPGIYVESPVTI
jgi:small-conductance mechanosensitive channel